MTEPARLYQTLITLNPRNQPRTSHDMHRAIEHLAHGARTLWARPNRHRLILRTPQPAVPWETLRGARRAATTTARTHWPTDTRIDWALIANPTKANPHHRVTPDGRGRRTPLPPSDVPAWAARKLTDALHLHDEPTAELLPPATGRGITLTRYAITGTATVTNPTLLAHLLTAGVGPGKGLGCGLLLIREDRAAR